MQAIVIGISFLGAGTIIHQGNDRVEGLTTAASIFLTAGLGIAVAVGQVVLAAGITVFAVIVLALVGWIERRLGGSRRKECRPGISQDSKSSAEHSHPETRRSVAT